MKISAYACETYAVSSRKKCFYWEVLPLNVGLVCWRAGGCSGKVLDSVYSRLAFVSNFHWVAQIWGFRGGERRRQFVPLGRWYRPTGYMVSQTWRTQWEVLPEVPRGGGGGSGEKNFRSPSARANRLEIFTLNRKHRLSVADSHELGLRQLICRIYK
jgi:hypothetical protein